MDKNKIPNSKKMIIRDAVDIETDIKDEIPEDKTSLTDSEEVRYSTIDLRHQHLKIFSLLTTSDKEINMRMYPDQHVQDMCKRHSWTTPYAKPLQTNHDIYCDANARFFDSWYLNHKDLNPQYGYGQLPQGVIDEFNKRNAFSDGTGSTIGMAETANLDFKKKIIDGTYLTTSQGAATDSLTCNICGNSYRDWRNCSHFRGSTYPILSEDGKTITEMRKCVPYTGALDAVEDSVVNHPANDTSTLLVFDTKKNRVVNMDNIHEYSDIFEVVKPVTPTADNKDNENNQTVVTDNKQQGLSEEQIKLIQKMLDEGKQPSANILNQPAEPQTQDTVENTKDNAEDNQDKGGHMSYKIKNATAKRVFKEDIKALGVKDMEKVGELFDKYDDTQIEMAMDFLGFIMDNIEVEEPAPAQTTTEATTDNNGEGETATTTEATTTENEDNKTVTESEEYKAVKDQLDKAMKMLCDLKGIDNEVPDLATLEAKINDAKKSANKINDFDF